MASTIVFTCPECDKQIKGPAELEGKTIRCKACGEAFVVKTAPAKSTAKSAGGKPKAKAPASKKAKDDEDDGTPYGMRTQKLKPRCPHCAAEFESEDAVICLECGYNTVTRQQVGTKKVVETTGADVMMWLLPGIMCVVGICFLLAIDIVLVLWMISFADEKNDIWHKLKLGTVIWGGICTLFVIYFLAKFAINRLILNPTPPEDAS